MCVVPAGVHHMDILTFVIFGDDLAGVRQTSFFFHWQRIHIRAHDHGRSVAILHHSHDAVTFEFGVLIFAEMLGDLAACRAQFLCNQCCSSLLMSG